MAHVLVGHVAWRSFARPTTHINSVCPAISKGYVRKVHINSNVLSKKLSDVHTRPTADAVFLIDAVKQGRHLAHFTVSKMKELVIFNYNFPSPNPSKMAIKAVCVENDF